MANKELFHADFDLLAGNTGVLGDPSGSPAYGYGRVSSVGQFQEGRSGIPRQMEHCHMVAMENKKFISWDMFYADDSSGFEFEHRPMLNQMFSDMADRNSSGTLIFENIDRLSRDADWHVGYLLNKLKNQLNVNVLSWKDIGSRLVRNVEGIANQEVMEYSMERMRFGAIKKAGNGYITAKKRAFGYIFVDKFGNELVKPGKFPYYAKHPDEAKVVELIYESIGIEQLSIRETCKILDERFIHLHKNKKFDPSWISDLVRNPVYYGEFKAFRNKSLKIDRFDNSGLVPIYQGKYNKMVANDDDEKIVSVEVKDAIVSPDLWKMANDRLDRNRDYLRARSKSQFLLSGLLRCVCGAAMTGNSSWSWNGDPENGIKNYYRRYACQRKAHPEAYEKSKPCSSKKMHSAIIDDIVWRFIRDNLLNPDAVMEGLDELLHSDTNKNLLDEIKYLEKELNGVADEIEELYQLRRKRLMPEEEYGVRRQNVEDRKKLIAEIEIPKLKGRMISEETIQFQKNILIDLSQQAKEFQIDLDVPFELKRKFINTIVDKIVMDAENEMIYIYGLISGEHKIENNTPRGSYRYKTDSKKDEKESGYNCDTLRQNSYNRLTFKIYASIPSKGIYVATSIECQV